MDPRPKSTGKCSTHVGVYRPTLMRTVENGFERCLKIHNSHDNRAKENVRSDSHAVLSPITKWSNQSPVFAMHSFVFYIHRHKRSDRKPRKRFPFASSQIKTWFISIDDNFNDYVRKYVSSSAFFSPFLLAMFGCICECSILFKFMLAADADTARCEWNGSTKRTQRKNKK